MLTLKEITKIDPSQVNPEKLKQCQDLCNKVNIVLKKWNKTVSVTSGVRTWEEHIRIYKDIAAKKQHPFPDGVFTESKVPKLSKHLDTVTDCAAVDIADPKLELKNWLKNTPEGQACLEEANLWCEDDNIGRVHFQNKAFGSYKKGGTRWFKP